MYNMSRKRWNIRLELEGELLEKFKKIMVHYDVWSGRALMKRLIEEAHKQLEGEE